VADYSDLAYSLSGLGKPANPYDQRRKFAYSMMQQGADASPIQSPWQGVSRLAQALVGGLMLNKTEGDEQEANKKRSDALAQAMAEPDPQKRIGLIAAYDPDAGARAAGSLAVEQAKLGQQTAMLNQGANSFGQSYGAPQGQPAGGPQQAGFQPTLAGYEANNNPQAVNPQSGAGGLYQFLPGTWANVRASNPDLNLPATVGEASDQQQHAAEQRFRTANAQGLQQAGIPVNPTTLYLAHRTGVDGTKTILSASPDAPLSTVVPPQWVQQNPDMRTTVGQFVQMAQSRFPSGPPPQGAPPPAAVAALPQGAPQPYGGPQGDNPAVAPGQPPQPSPQGVSGPAVVAPPGVPDVPRPQPTPQQIQQVQQRLRSGEFGFDASAVSKARAALDADLDRQWGVQRDQAKMGYDAQLSSFGRRESNDLQQPQNNAQNESKMREQFDQLQTVKDYRKANTVFRSAIDAAKNDTKASDLNLVYAFATLMDPGSVVRESETGMVTATASASARVQGLINGLQGKSTFDNATRQALVAEMASRYQAYKTAHDDLAGTFGGIADRTPGVNRQNVVVPYPDVQYERPTVAQMPGASSPPPPPGYKVMK
jgi:hypothetical protein